MNKFLLYVFKIIFFGLISAYIMQFIADAGLKKIENSIFQDWDRLLGGKLNSDIIILGSSRSFVSLNPNILEKTTNLSTYNLSFNAGSYNLQNLKYKAYLKNNTPPKIIIQNIDMAHFTESNRIPAPYQFIPFLDNKNLQSGLVCYFDEYLLKTSLPLYKYNSEHRLLLKGIQSFFGRTYILFPTQKGFSSKNISFKRDSSNIERLKSLEKESINQTKYSKGIISIENLVDTPKISQTLVVLIWLPEYSERLELNKELRLYLKNQVKKIVADNKSAVFIDYSNDSISFDRKYFYDTFHLNKEGAQLMSKKLADTLKAINNL